MASEDGDRLGRVSSGEFAAALLVIALALTACAADGEDTQTSPVVGYAHSCVALGCEFDGPASLPTGESIVTWHWSFGDEARSTSRNPSHVYLQAGTFDVAMTVTSRNGTRATRVETVTVTESAPADVPLPPIELGFGTRQAGRYVTNWSHVDPGFSFSIDEGWWATDTLTALTLGPLSEQGAETCDPVLRILRPRGLFDPGTQAMVPFTDLTNALVEDPRMRVDDLVATLVGGYPASRIDATLAQDQLDTSWRGCGYRVYQSFAIGTLDLEDRPYQWVWIPVSEHLRLWVVDVDAFEVMIVAAYSGGAGPVLDQLQTVVESLEFDPPHEPVLTRTLYSEFGEIEILNGTLRLHSQIEWAVSRFVESGIGSPGVRGVTFSAGALCSQHGYSGGFSAPSPDGSHVYLCFGEERQDSQARPTILHEFGHAWLGTHADPSTSAEFLALLGLSSSELEAVGLPEAGVEYAADIIAWGLGSAFESHPRLAGHSCESLLAAFETLTGAPPLAAATDCSSPSS